MVAAWPRGGIRPPQVSTPSCGRDFRCHGPLLASYHASLVAGGPAASGPGLPELLFPSLYVFLCSLRPHNCSGNFLRDWVSTCPSRICHLELIQGEMMPLGLFVLVSLRHGELCAKFRWCWCSLAEKVAELAPCPYHFARMWEP